MTLREVIGIALIFSGIFFSSTGVIGIIRLPDVYSRLHAAGKVSTLGLLGLLAGVAVLMPETTIKMTVLALFMLITSPVSTHAIASAAYRQGVRPERALQDALATREMPASPVIGD